jgi:pyroglutamyl-peptidase
MAALANESAEAVGAGAFRAILLPADYRRSWSKLRRLYAGFSPDVVVHFGLAARADRIRVERLGNILIDRQKPDAAGFAPRLGRAARAGAASLQSTFPAVDIAAALNAAGFDAVLSDDAGDYVCNATLYRSLAYAPAGRRIGFIHVPPENVLAAPKLREAAALILRAACRDEAKPALQSA